MGGHRSPVPFNGEIPTPACALVQLNDLAAEMPELVRQLQSAMPLREHA